MFYEFKKLNAAIEVIICTSIPGLFMTKTSPYELCLLNCVLPAMVK